MKSLSVACVIVAGVICVVTLAGCSAPKGPSAKAVRVGCEDAVSQAVASGRADASLYAKAGLTYQVQDLKGYMLNDGYRNVTVRSERVECRPYQLMGGLTQCSAIAKLCSR